MTAEFQVPSPLVPTRENYFVRYCKQHSDATWAVVDVSLDNLRPSPISRSRRRPSGCLIQELPNGYSKVMITYLSAPLFILDNVVVKTNCAMSS
jgi:homeobox-leucine zipper protein